MRRVIRYLMLAMLLLPGASVASAREPGCFLVLARNGNPAGAAWLIDRSEGLLLTAAHVVGDAGCKTPGDPLRIEAVRVANQLRGGPLLRLPLQAKLVAWGAADNGQAPEGWVQRIRLQPDADDWAIVRLDDRESDPAAAVLESFEPFMVNRFMTATGLESLAATPTKFRTIGFPSGTESGQSYDGYLRQRRSTTNLWTLGLPVAGGNSGGPVYHLDGGRPVGCGLVIHKSSSGPAVNDHYAIAIGLYSVLETISDRVPQSRRVERIAEMLRTPAAERQPADWLRMLNAMESLAFYEHDQLAAQMCENPGQEADCLNFLIHYYEEYRAPLLVARLLNCRPEFASVLGRYAGQVTAEADADEGSVDPAAAGLIRAGAEHALTRAERADDAHWVERAGRERVAALLRNAVFVSDRVDGWAESSEFRQRAAIRSLDLDPPNLESASDLRQTLALLAAANPPDRGWEMVPSATRVNFALELADGFRIGERGETLTLMTSSSYRSDQINRILSDVPIRESGSEIIVYDLRHADWFAHEAENPRIGDLEMLRDLVGDLQRNLESSGGGP